MSLPPFVVLLVDDTDTNRLHDSMSHANLLNQDAEMVTDGDTVLPTFIADEDCLGVRPTLLFGIRVSERHIDFETDGVTLMLLTNLADRQFNHPSYRVAIGERRNH